MIHRITQGDTTWHHLRAGMVTASRFGDVLTDARPPSRYSVENRGGKTKDKNWTVYVEDGGEIVADGFQRREDADKSRRALDAKDRDGMLSTSADSYLNEVVGELIAGKPLVGAETKAMQWGREWEEVARSIAAERLRDKWGEDLRLPEDEEAFVPHFSEPGIGASPDFLVGDHAAGEIKCSHNWKHHVRRLRDPEGFMARHRFQVNGGAWCIGPQITQYWLVSFDSRFTDAGLHLWMRAVEPDRRWIDMVLAPRVCTFRDRVQEEYLKLTGQPF